MFCFSFSAELHVVFLPKLGTEALWEPRDKPAELEHNIMRTIHIHHLTHIGTMYDTEIYHALLILRL